jgi:hypothetical protein
LPQSKRRANRFSLHNVQIKPSRPGGGHGKPLNFPKSSKRVSSWRAFCGRIMVILGRPWCQGTALVPGKPALVPAGPARNTRESVVGRFCGRESNCQILCRSLELLVWWFQK